MALLAATPLRSPGPSGPSPQDRFPTTGPEAMDFYEAWGERWLEGPVEYIVLDEEREIWKELAEAEQREAFIRWFWARRDDDPRDRTVPFRSSFYERVAEANSRFHGFPRGWRSDRGRVWIILGRPDSIRRATAAQLFGVPGPEFTVWTYFTPGRPYSNPFGELAVLFVESRPGSYEVYDVRFGAGSYPPYLRRTFEIVREAAIADPRLEFEPTLTDAGFIRAAAGGELPLEVPVEGWERAAAGVLALPVRVPLEALLFRADGGRLRATLNLAVELRPSGSDQRLGVRREWVLELTEEELAAHGRGWLHGVVAAAAPAGTYAARMAVQDPTGGAVGRWEGEVEVLAEGAAASPPVVGVLGVALAGDDPGGLAVIAPEEGALAAGGDVVVACWIRGRVPSIEAVALTLVPEEGPPAPVRLTRVRWLDGPAGPLLLEATLPEVVAGSYELRVELGPGAPSVPPAALRLSSPAG